MVVVPSHYVARIMYLCNKIHMATCFCWVQKWVVFLSLVRLWTLILIVRRNERENFQAMEMFEKCIENCNKEYWCFHHGCYNCTKSKLLSNNNTPYLLFMFLLLRNHYVFCFDPTKCSLSNYYHNRRIFDQDGYSWCFFQNA